MERNVGNEIGRAAKPAVKTGPLKVIPVSAPSPVQPAGRSRLELLFMAFFAASLLTLFGFIFVFVKYGVDLPDYKSLADYKPPITSRFYAGDGSLLTEYATEKRIFVELSDIPQELIHAFLSAEDKNFWSHSGIDMLGIFRAVVDNASSALLGGRRAGGASTITQQVAKNFLLSSERTIARKLKEVILALKMERTFSKKHILTLYMNQIFLGHRSFGVAAAAQNYFGKSLSELTLSESAFLAALPKAPSAYNPVTNPDRALARRNWVLDRMYGNGYITGAQRAAAQAEPIGVSDSLSNRQQRYALYFSEEVRKSLAEIYGEEQLYSGGLAVRTTINPRYQEIATKALRRALLAFDRRRGWRGAEENMGRVEGDEWPQLLKRSQAVSGMEDEGWRKAIVLHSAPGSVSIGLPPPAGVAQLSETSLSFAHGGLRSGDIVFASKNEGGTYELRQVPEVNGAMVALDPHTGRVYALVGGFSYSRSKFNRATQAWRQPGSSIKPFVYLTALEKGFTPSSIVLDAPIVLEREGGEMWRPENYDNKFDGEITFRRALEQSKNNPTIRIALDIGLRSFLDTARRFGVYKSIPHANLSMALGSGDTHLLDLAAAFAKIFNGGRSIEPILVDRVQDRDGRTIYNKDERECPACRAEWAEDLLPPEIPDPREQLADPVSIYQITHLMEGVVQYGSGWQARIPGRAIAGKTGTSNDQKDVWFVGGTPDLVVGVFLGYDQPKSLGSYSAGGTLAAPVFHDFMEQALEGVKSGEFRVPDGVSFVRVNRFTGRRATSADPPGNVVLEAFREGTESSAEPARARNPEGGAPAASPMNFYGIF